MAAHPHYDPARTVRTRMGGSEPARFLICAERARVWAPIRTEHALPEHVEIAQTADRKRRDWIVDVIMNPPRAPFLAASVGMSGADAAFWRMTTSAELIAFGGAGALFDGKQIILIERERFIQARIWFREASVPVSDVLRYRDVQEQFQKGLIGGDAARAALARIKSERDVLDGYPGVRDASIVKLAAYAATEWDMAE